MHKGFVEVANDATHSIAAEAERVAADEPHNGSDAHRHETLYHDAEDIPLTGKAAVKEGKAGCHEHNKAGSQEHKTGGAGIKCCHVFIVL
jgi:hypothetical protein